MNRFKAGDTVVCVNDQNTSQLTRGREYNVVEVDGIFLYIDNPAGGWCYDRFSLALTQPKEDRGGGLKDDSGKEQPRLLHQGCPLALAEVVKTLTFGARKYAPNSWQLVEDAANRYQDASYRHDSKRCQGELIDPETNVRHRAHHIINELFLLELELRGE